jgi:hypothetical protein
MALLCLVRSPVGCYCADRVVGIPPRKVNEFEPDWGVFDENDAPVLCGNWLCGGPLDIPAECSSCRSGYTVSVSGPSVQRFCRLGRAPRCASISSARAQRLLPSLLPSSRTGLISHCVSEDAPRGLKPAGLSALVACGRRHVPVLYDALLGTIVTSVFVPSVTTICSGRLSLRGFCCIVLDEKLETWFANHR